ncbi:biotin--[acetyl-CoA-carboxylase] ligase [soil metagenome]
MQLPLSHAIAPLLELVPRVGSTNAELVARASGAPHFSVLATTDQTAGRGRLGRVWIAPPGKTLAVSVLLAPGDVSLERLGWIPLLAGLAMTRAVAGLVPAHAVSLKWPNDVHIDGLKVSGLLTEYVAGAHAIVVGAGLNLTMNADELPTPTSTSLTLNGAVDDELLDAALSAYLGELQNLYTEFAGARFDAAAGLRREVVRVCSTLGRRVRVELPGGDDLYGSAEDIDGEGRLVVRERGVVHSVAAGDVTHLRYE